MKKLLPFLTFILVFFGAAMASTAAARALELTKIGTTELMGQGIGSTVTTYTYPLRSFSLYGTAVASSAVSIKIDDVTYSATADAAGAWSTYLSNLTEASHAVIISAPSQTSLNFTLIIDTENATTTATATTTTTTTKGGDELPQAGALENTFLTLFAALFALGLGVTLRYRDAL